MSNIFAFYKPKGITSNDAVQKVRSIVGRSVKVGHAGTLDPLAQGVLVIAVGREATKKISEVVKKEKEYIAEITLGSESSTDDAEGEKTLFNVSKRPVLEEIIKIFPEFIGRIKQMPPIYSAIKIQGREAYKYARQGQVVEMKSREVEIKNIEIYGPQDSSIRSSVIAFNLNGIHPHDVAAVLDTEGIAIRSGHACCKPLMKRLDILAMCRASFYIYNSVEEVDALVKGLEKVNKTFSRKR
ncbi:MAG: tRNA pseudouridine(55) synthase TruB [Patescibacteria group bacterium]